MAVVTNVRDPLAAQTGPSRGALVADFLRGRDPAAVHIERLATVAGAYAPFNLLLADGDSLEYLGNHPAERQRLGPGAWHVQRRAGRTLAEDPTTDGRA